jgi:hypothetical protein
MEAYLRCFVHSCPKKWSTWLPLAEYWYNTTYHSVLGKTPFEVLYGHPPRNFGIEAASCVSTDLETWLKERSTMQSLLQQHLLRAQQRMKCQADKKRSERSFQVGDMVFLKLQPYIQQSVATRGTQKLTFRYFGPYKVLQRIGEVAYKLELPASSQVHPVVHVSQIKKHIPANTQVHTSLNLMSDDPIFALVPAKVLWRSLIPHGAALLLASRCVGRAIHRTWRLGRTLMPSAAATRTLLLGVKQCLKGDGNVISRGCPVYLYRLQPLGVLGHGPDE